MKKELSEGGRQELALAFLLWKDFKSQGKMDLKIMQQAASFAKEYGVSKEFDELLIKLPPLKIEPRYK